MCLKWKTRLGREDSMEDFKKASTGRDWIIEVVKMFAEHTFFAQRV